MGSSYGNDTALIRLRLAGGEKKGGLGARLQKMG